MMVNELLMSWLMMLKQLVMMVSHGDSYHLMIMNPAEKGDENKSYIESFLVKKTKIQITCKKWSYSKCQERLNSLISSDQ